MTKRDNGNKHSFFHRLFLGFMSVLKLWQKLTKNVCGSYIGIVLKGFISLLVQLEKQEEDYEGLENMTLHTCKLLASMEDLIISFPPKHLSVTLQPFRSQINELILPLRHSNQNPLCTSLVDDIKVLGHDMFDAKLSYWRSSVSYQAFYQDLSVCSIIERCSCKNEITRSLMVAKNSQLCKKIFYSISFSSS